jgi:amphi-Trp domain-containing protein
MRRALAWGKEVAARKRRAKRDIEKDYSKRQFITKLRRLADCLENGDRFRIQVAGERVSVPPDVSIQIEHERGAGEEEIEFQLRWKLD